MIALSFGLGIPIFLFTYAEVVGLKSGLSILPASFELNFLLFILATLVQFVAGRRFYSGFLHAIKARSANMDTLIVVGTTAAWSFSTLVTFFPDVVPPSSRAVYFDASALIIWFHTLR